MPQQKVRRIRPQSQKTGGPRAGRKERPLTVRLDQRRVDVLTGLAFVDQTTVAEQIRNGCTLYVKSRLNDPNLEGEIEAATQRFKMTLNLLHDETAPCPPTGSQAPHRDPDSEKSVTLRLGYSMIDYLSTLALLDGYTLADEIRRAIDMWTQEKLSDPELESAIKRNRRECDELIDLLCRLAS